MKHFLAHDYLDMQQPLPVNNSQDCVPPISVCATNAGSLRKNPGFLLDNLC